MKKHYYGLKKDGTIVKVYDMFDKNYILMSTKKRDLKLRLNWYVKNGFAVTISPFKEETK